VSEEQGKGSDRRDYYRIIYPRGDEPVLVIAGLHYPIVDLAEGGLKFRISGSLPIFKGGALKASIIFHDDQVVEVAGKMIRKSLRYVVVHLDHGIPLKKIMEEQRFLLKKHKVLL
jgi:hypothetical protein